MIQIKIQKKTKKKKEVLKFLKIGSLLNIISFHNLKEELDEVKTYNLIEPHRHFIYEGKLQYIKNKLDLFTEERAVILFNDLLLICKIPTEDKNGLDFDFEIKLKKVLKRVWVRKCIDIINFDDIKNL
jgi:hypothetical protein